MRMMRSRVRGLALLLLLHFLHLGEAQDEAEDRKSLVRNIYRRRGASLSSERARDRGTMKRREELSSREYVRSIRQSGHFSSSPALRFLMARRLRWSGEPQTGSSETVIVKSLPYYPGAREVLARLAREPLPSPQVHSFSLERAREERRQEEEAVLRQSLVESPRSAALLLEPVPAVPTRPLPPVLRAVPAVPDLPTLSSFTTPFPRISSTSPRSLSRGASPFSRPPLRSPSPTPFRARQRLSPVSAVPRASPSSLPPRAPPSSQPAPLPQPLAQTQARQAPQSPGPQAHQTTSFLPEAPRSHSPFPGQPSAPPAPAPGTVRVTTRRPVADISQLIHTTVSKRIRHPILGLLEADDPCLDGNHQVIAGQPQRSFNHHLSVGSTAPVCDNSLPEAWYRFESPAGNLLPTECPGGNYCGTHIPVWMKGSVPSVRQGVMGTTACINQDRECCVGELEIAVRNCSSWVAYRLVPTPACNMGYCVGEGVPCPEGLASSNGYTPCDFTVKLDRVVLTQSTNPLQSEIVFHCSPVLRDVIEPSSIEIDVKWFVDGDNVLSETFNAEEQSSGSLSEGHWRMGQTIQCEAQAKHNVVGARTERLKSKAQFAGILVTGGPVTVAEGGAVQHIILTATVPVLCSPQDRAFGQCCVELELTIGGAGEEQHCPLGGVLDRVGLPSCSHRICRNDWNSSHVIPLRALDDHLHNPSQLLALEIRTGQSSTPVWADYTLPLVEVTVVPGTQAELCMSDAAITTFDRVKYRQDQQGSFVLYRHISRPFEVQVNFRTCNLRQICHCSVAVRIGDLVVAFDICSKGYLQVWARDREGVVVVPDSLPEGARLLSIDEGRAYELYFPSGTVVSLGPYLSHVKVTASAGDLESTEGLCGNFDRDQDNEFQLPGGEMVLESGEFISSWLLPSDRTLFTGHFPSDNLTLGRHPGERDCACRQEKGAGVNEISTARFIQAEPESVCSRRTCEDPRAESVLARVVALSRDEELGMVSLKMREEREEDVEGQVATVKVAGGPVLPRPPEGWTLGLATEFCSDFLATAPALEMCRGVPGVDLETILGNCGSDVEYAGDTRAAQLHLDIMKESCRHSVTRNTSLWAPSPLGSDPTVPQPPQNILDNLCLNDCSQHGQCSKGVCLCAEGFSGADCGVSLASAPRVARLSNSGLCDVRGNPCRNFVVSGGNFADSPGLVCHFEIFKIRGVASKQLVQDNILSSPASFLTFQQVLCRLPTLDIHSNKERHRFDLRDNTDQTRRFVKVSVGYGPGPRSPPLDLLLYDSQCWHCSLTGECNAKPNNKCVFSAATSSVQTFRIGKSISGEGSDFHICSLPHDSGSCDRKEFRYFYNSLERRCKLFVYGGCKGNQNNFLSEIDCVRRCGDEAAIAALPSLNPSTQLEEIDQCSQVKDEGICPGNVPRFYFDKADERCLLFSYGGCGGNTNNFQTEEGCISTCGGPTGALIHAIHLHGGLKPRKPICSLSINRGGCQAKLRRFYFDSRDETCKLFVFGGCQGNENNFETMQECVINCGGPALHPSSTSSLHPDHSTTTFAFTTATTRSTLSFLPRTLTPLAASKRILKLTTEPTVPTLASTTSVLPRNTSRAVSTHTPAEIAFTSISLPSISPCGLPRQVGACNSFRDRYHFDIADKMCKKFRFSGCGGNGNNFMTGENCVKNCGGVIEDVVLSKKHITERLVLPTMKTTTTTTTRSPTNYEDSSGFRKRKMKRVKIGTRDRRRERVEVIRVPAATEVSERERARSQAVLNRARLRSRMSSSSSVVSSSTEQSVSLNELDRGFRRPSRTVAHHNVSQFELQYLDRTREDFEKVKGPRADLYRPRIGPRIVFHNETRHKYSLSRRVDEVMKAPPHMKGGLVIIRSYCRYPPDEYRRGALCVDDSEFYFYNVSTASCQPLRGAVCTKSRNKFATKRTCLKSCIVDSQENLGSE